MKINDKVKFIYDDCEMTCEDGELIFVIRGNVTIKNQSGGECRAYDNATLNSTGQEGGDCRAHDNATLNSTWQKGGYCRSFALSTLNSTDQEGGDCMALGIKNISIKK